MHECENGLVSGFFCGCLFAGGCCRMHNTTTHKTKNNERALVCVCVCLAQAQLTRAGSSLARSLFLSLQNTTKKESRSPLCLNHHRCHHSFSPALNTSLRFEADWADCPLALCSLFCLRRQLSLCCPLLLGACMPKMPATLAHLRHALSLSVSHIDSLAIHVSMDPTH